MSTACNSLPAVIAHIVPKTLLYRAFSDLGYTNIALQNKLGRN